MLPIIRKTTEDDVAHVCRIYDAARTFMRSRGNLRQWTGGYPSAASLRADMARGCSYVVELDGRPVATFFFQVGPEPTYREIFGGTWLDADAPYGVVHRAASDGSLKGVMKLILDHCFTLVGNIRIDTHRDNAVMQEALLRYGFSYRGIIYLENGDERLAYQLRR